MSALETADGARPSWCARLRSAFSLRDNLGALIHEPADAFAPLDGLRAIAALWVLAFHAVTIPLLSPVTGARLAPFAHGRLLRVVFSGHLSVDIFLVLAGFLITHLLIREREGRGAIDFVRFIRRRWLRIAPLYAAAVLVYMADDDMQRASCAHWGWVNLLFINNFFGPELQPQSCLGHGWSLAVEFQLYLVTPLLVSACFRSTASAGPGGLAPAWLATLGGIAVAAAIVCWYDVHPAADWYATALYDKPYGRSTPYCAGMLVAFAVRARGHGSLRSEGIASDGGARERSGPTRLAPGLATVAEWLALAAIVFLVLAPAEWVDPRSPFHLPLLIFGRPLFGFAIAYLVLRMLSARARWLARVLSWRVWLPIARLSYAAYLLQFVCIAPACAIFAASIVHAQGATALWGLWLAQTALSMISSFALALVGYLLVEKPFMNLRR